METLGLKNVNMLTKEQYNSVTDPAKDELWAVEMDSDNEFKATVVGWGMPDYSTAVSVTAPYTATYPCWFVGYSLASAGSNQIISVNGVDVARESGDYACTQIPLDIGDVVTINAGDLNGMRICAMKGID